MLHVANCSAAISLIKLDKICISQNSWTPFLLKFVMKIKRILQKDVYTDSKNGIQRI